jgi:hypothetical protein
MVSSNVPTSRHHGAPKHGDALLAGLLRCRRCGRKLTLRYSGVKHHIPRYSCSRGWMDNGEPRCIAFGGLRVDDAIEEALLIVVGPGAIAAAVAAEKEADQWRDQVREALERDLEAARYATDRAFRQYDAADPANRLVAGELEARWNKALARMAEVEDKIAAHDAAKVAPIADPASLATLAADLKTVWTAPSTDARLKKRIVRTVIHEVIADIDPEAAEIVLVVHWIGGVHSEIRLPRRRRGQRNSTSVDVIAAVRQLVLIANDDLIAGILNRNGLVTGHGNRWTRERVTSLRSHHRITIYKPVEGVSMVYSFDDAKAASTHRTQYFEMLANRAIYNDGWVAATTPPLAPWAVGKTINVDDYKWELYDVTKDFSEANDLAAKEPKRLHELQELFWIEAAKNNVLPLDNSKLERMNVDNRPSLTRGRALFTYYPGMTRIPEGSAPSILNKSFKIGAEVTIPSAGAEGVLVTQGGRFNGWGLYLLAGKPLFHYNTVGVYRSTVAGPDRLSPGNHTVLIDFKYDGGGLGKGGTATLMVDGQQVAQGKIERTIPFRISADETLDIGEDTGTPVSDDYQVPFKFSGDLKKVAIQLTDAALSAEDEAEIRRIRAEIGLSE